MSTGRIIVCGIPYEGVVARFDPTLGKKHNWGDYSEADNRITIGESHIIENERYGATHELTHAINRHAGLQYCFRTPKREERHTGVMASMLHDALSRSCWQDESGRLILPSFERGGA